MPPRREKAAPAPARIVFADPHAAPAGPVEGEATRVRKLTGAWRWLLVLATAATILLCINQQFTLRFFVGFTQLNTEYYYLLILCMLPFTFLIFPGSAAAAIDRIPWYDVLLFAATAASACYLMLNVRKAAELGWEFGGAPLDVVGAGLVMWLLLMEALRRTGGWSLLLSVLPFTVYPLFAEARWLGPLKGTQSTIEQATAYHVLSSESLLGIPIQAFAETVIGFLVFGTALMLTGAGKFFINLAFALCGTFRGGAAKVGIFASGLLGMMSGSVVSNVLTAGTMTIPTMKRTGFRASYAGAIEACASTGAVLAPPVMGATAFVIAQFLNVSYGEVAMAAIIPAALYYLALFIQVDAYAARNGLKGPAPQRVTEHLGNHQGGLVLPTGGGTADRHAVAFQARKPRTILRYGATASAQSTVFQGATLGCQNCRQFPGDEWAYVRGVGRHLGRLRPSDWRFLHDGGGL